MNTLFRNDRIRRILKDLKGYMYHSPIALDDIRMLEGRYDTPEEAARCMERAVPFPAHGRWGGRNSYAWFFIDVLLPESCRKEHLLFSLSTAEYEKADTAMLASFVMDAPGRWDLMNPQFMLFVNGTLFHGMDTNHTQVYLKKEDYADGRLRLALQAYTGLTDSYYSFLPELFTIDEPLKDLYYDMLTVFEAALTMPEDSVIRYELLDALNEAVNCLDMRLAKTPAFHKCVAAARQLLQDSAYTGEVSASSAITINCIGHTHIDMAWLWDLEQTRLKAQRSFSTVLAMQDRYPDYYFMHTSPQLYAYIREDNPELYARIKEQIKAGRWEPEGAMWIEADCNIPSGESLVRQILYGKAFIREEFNQDSKVLWMPDVFGYSAALPQILQKTGITCFVTSKISWNMLNTMPYDTFLWKGIDGSEILTYFLTTPELNASGGNCGATYNAVLHPDTLYGAWKQYKQKEINHDLLICYGYGDGGGGPTNDMLEKLARLKQGIKGFPKIQSGPVRPFFDKLAAELTGKKYMPKWSGELYLELHQGTYTSCGEIKRNNRLAEHLLLSAEWLDSICLLLGGTCHDDQLAESWRLLLLNQFHDILPGSCIKKVYDDLRQQFASLFDGLERLITEAMEVLADRIQCKQDGILLINPSSFPGNGVLSVPASLLSYSGGSYIFTDSKGNRLTMQPEETGNYLVDVPVLPALGYTMLYPAAAPAELKPQTAAFPISPSHMENAFYSLDFDTNGEINSLIDKRCERQLLISGHTGNRLIAFDDRPYKWDNWNIDMYYEECAYPLPEPETAVVTEAGPLRYGLRQVRHYNKSSVTQTIYLYRESPRIDFVTEVDWKEDSTVLKAEFPLAVNSDYALYDIQFGNVRRPTHSNTSWDIAKYEVCAHKWADLSEGGYGVSLLNDCKYGYSIQESTIRITLLKAGMSPDPTLDRGIHRFTYSLLPHMGSCYEGPTIEEAFRLNQPCLMLPVKAHSGILPEQLAFITCPDKNIIIETFKHSEDKKAYILRMYETCNTTVSTSIRFALPFLRAEECNLLEEPVGDFTLLHTDTLRFTIKPFEIKTFKIYWEENV